MTKEEALRNYKRTAINMGSDRIEGEGFHRIDLKGPCTTSDLHRAYKNLVQAVSK